MHPPAAHAAPDQAPSGRTLLLLSFAALGVVFGDLGTSPLYALQEAFRGPGAVPVNRANILGVLSLFIWGMTLVVSVKYAGFIMRADNNGEGGVLALLARITERPPREGGHRARAALVVLGLIGAALLYGDGVITPAISVLSAVEGLELAAPSLAPYVVPITAAILVGLFLLQPWGSDRVGRVFAPVLLVWFAVAALLGIRGIRMSPDVLHALNPVHGIRFFAENGWRGFPVLGAVVLCLTGGEALYADMGHFGRRPIRMTWYVVAAPALIVCYLGQGGLLLREPAAAARPFFSLVPEWALIPTVILATLATVIASQALISAVFSLTQQAVQLGYLPRVRIVHTSSAAMGQIYLPTLNWVLMAACLALVFGFRSSGSLAAAFGIAVAGTMTITTVLFAYVARVDWRWPAAAVALFVAIFLTIDVALLAANVLKIMDGGWLPIVIGGLAYLVMRTWACGRRLLGDRIRAEAMPLPALFERIRGSAVPRVPGTAVFMSWDRDFAPGILLHHLRHNQALHERVILLTILNEERPYTPKDDRVSVDVDLPLGFCRVVGRCGFMESPSVPRLLHLAEPLGVPCDPDRTTFYLNRDRVIPSDRPRGMARWRETLFGIMQRNARTTTDYLHLPIDRVIELGAQVPISG